MRDEARETEEAVKRVSRAAAGLNDDDDGYISDEDTVAVRFERDGEDVIEYGFVDGLSKEGRRVAREVELLAMLRVSMMIQ